MFHVVLAISGRFQLIRFLMKLKRIITTLAGHFGRHVYAQIRSIFARPKYTRTEINYNEYWRKREFIEIQPRFPIISKMIERGATVLDVGCGDGGLLLYLKEHRDQILEVGIDISDVAIERCVSRGLNCMKQTLSAFEAESARQKRTFDYVIMSEVIEHVPNSEEFVQTAWGLTRGKLIISFPNIAYWPHRLRLLLGRNPVQWAHFQAEHLRFWSVSDFTDWLSAMELPSANISHKVIGTSGTCSLGLCKLWPNLFANQVIVTVERE